MRRIFSPRTICPTKGNLFRKKWELLKAFEFGTLPPFCFSFLSIRSVFGAFASLSDTALLSGFTMVIGSVINDVPAVDWKDETGEIAGNRDAISFVSQPGHYLAITFATKTRTVIAFDSLHTLYIILFQFRKVLDVFPTFRGTDSDFGQSREHILQRVETTVRRRQCRPFSDRAFQTFPTLRPSILLKPGHVERISSRETTGKLLILFRERKKSARLSLLQITLQRRIK